MAKSAWVIFDADNTLWDVESLYDDARGVFLKLLSSRGHDVEEVEEFQRNADARLFKTRWYSSKRFAASFDVTIDHFEPDAGEELRARANQIANQVFETPAEPVSDAYETLLALEQKFKLGLITAGPRRVQKKRLSDFFEGKRELFDATMIVRRKFTSTYKKFNSANDVALRRSWCVGDSLRSDVLPARRSGLNAIHVRHYNWTKVETNFKSSDSRVISVEEISDILPILLA